MYPVYHTYTDRWTRFGNVLQGNQIQIPCSYKLPILILFWSNITHTCKKIKMVYLQKLHYKKHYKI